MLTIDSQVHAYERNHPGRPWAGVLHGPTEVTGDHDRIGVIYRRRLDPDQHLARGRLGDRHLGDGQLVDAAPLTAN